MHKVLIYVTYGWLALAGMLHFSIDVLSQYFRGKRIPSAETTLYYGLNSAFALSQALFGMLALLVAWSAPDIVASQPAVVLDLLAATGWLAICFFFLEYREPKLTSGLFVVLVFFVAFTG
jgi:hypothetical protein